MVLPLRRRQLRERATFAEAPRQLQSTRELVSGQALDTRSFRNRQTRTRTLQATGKSEKPILLLHFFAQLFQSLKPLKLNSFKTVPRDK